MMKRLLRVAACLTLVMAACSGSPAAEPKGNLVGYATFPGADGQERTNGLGVADSDEERQQGLMGVRSLGEDRGMVFVFDGEQEGGFWMKDTLIPLSIAFWGKDGRVLDILEMQPCTAEPCPVYVPDATYTHALEMDAGWFSARGIEIGDRVELQLVDG